jgi:hypothetical protein
MHVRVYYCSLCSGSPSDALALSRHKLDALARPAHAESMARLRRQHQAGRLGSRGSMQQLADDDVANEDDGIDEADNALANLSMAEGVWQDGIANI